MRRAQVALLLQERLGGKTRPIISGQYRLGDIRHGYADVAAIRARFQFAPEVSLEDGLTRFIEWVKTQVAEPDRLDQATSELVARGLMPAHVRPTIPGEAPAEIRIGVPDHVPDNVSDDIPDNVQVEVHAKAASV